LVGRGSAVPRPRLRPHPPRASAADSRRHQLPLRHRGRRAPPGGPADRDPLRAGPCGRGAGRFTSHLPALL